MSASLLGGVRAPWPAPGRCFALAAFVAAGMLGAAFWFQFVGGLHPCELCVYQRYPYGVVTVLAVLGWLSTRTAMIPGGISALLAAGIAIAFLANAGIAGFHVGVEQGWWRGTESCAGGDIDTGDLEAMRDAILNAPVVRCDAVAWSLFGLSMAAWNGAIAFLLGLGSLAVLTSWRRS